MFKLVKRNLSVLLTVLMLLSCWVFVAPEKAKAAVEQEMYEIEVAVSLVNDNDRDDNYYTITYKRPNGTTGTVKKYRAAELGPGGTGKTEYRIDTFSLDGIPIRLDYACNGNEVSCWYIMGVSLVSGDQKTLFQGQLGGETLLIYKRISAWIDFTNKTSGISDNGTDDKRHNDWTNKDACTATSQPHVAQLTMERRPDEAGDIQIPNEAGDYGTTGTTFYVKDQFGVRLGSNCYNVTVTPKDSAQSAYISAHSDDSYASNLLEGYAIDVAEGARRLQTVYNKNTGTWGGGGDTRFDEPLTLTVTDRKQNYTLTEDLILPLTQPEYEVFFSEYTGGDGEVSPESYPRMVYSLPIGSLPSADRPGYTFLGFFKGSGGVTENSTPPSSWGEQVTENTIVNGENTEASNSPYHCGWTYAPCTVTVKNNRGKTVRTVTGKYDHTLNGSTLSSILNDPAAAYEKAPGETGEYNDLRPYKLVVESGMEYVSSSQQERSEAQIGKDLINDNLQLEGDITVRIHYRQTNASKYTIQFFDKSTTPISSNANYTYGQYAAVPSGEFTWPEDNTYTYTFAGWAKQRHAGDKNYFLDAHYVTVKDDEGVEHTELEVSQAIPLVDVANTPIVADVNYVAVYARVFKTYDATFHYTKDGDEKQSFTQEDAYHYNGHITPPASIERETENGKVTDNPTASFVARGYVWEFAGWYTEEEGGTLVDFGNMADPNSNLTDVGGMEYWAQYEQGDPTSNRIRFFTKAGALLESANVDYSETDVTTVPAMEASAYNKLRARNLLNYETDTMRYTFDKWVNVQNGEELPYSEKPLTPADYYPSYIEEPLLTLRLYNEKNELYNYTDVAGATLDISQLSDAILHPTRNADAYSEEYTFKGWSETESVLWTEGETLVDLSNFVFPDHDVDLYAHYDAVPINYTVRFLRDDQETEISTQTLHFGDPIVEPTLSEEDKVKSSDYQYNYTFMGWNLPPADTCTGNVDYFMTFRQGYQYYTVNWLDYSGGLFKSEKYVYNGHIHMPYNEPETPAYTDPETGDPDTSRVNVFDYWEYVNADGAFGETEIGRFVIGQKLGGATQEEIDNGKYTGPLTPAYWAANNNVITLRARYTDTENVVTITRYDGIVEDGKPFGNEIGKSKVPYGTTYGELQVATSVYTPQYTAEGHWRFSKWNRITGETTSSPMADSFSFTADTSIVEIYTSEPHGGTNGALWSAVVTKAPTFSEEGVRSRTCTAEGCGYTENTVVIPVLQDTTAPIGKLYVKENQWSAYPQTLSESPIQTAQNNMVIVNAEDMANNAGDTAANAEFNSKGFGSGVASIQIALVDGDALPASPSEITTWYTGYTYDEDAAPNASLTIGNLLNLDGEGAGKLFPQIENEGTFVIYVKLTDNATAANGAAQANVTYLRSDLLVLDTTSPVIEITSTDNMTNSIRHCEDATITVTDNELATVTLNGASDYQLPDEERLAADIGGLTEITVGEDTFPATDKGAQRTMEGGKFVYLYNSAGEGEDPVYERYTADEATATTYTPEAGEGEDPADIPTYTLIPLYDYRYNTAEDGEDPVYATVALPAGETTVTVDETTYDVEPLHTYTYTLPGAVRPLVELVQEGLTITRRGQYQIVAIDRAGNNSKANFEIIGSHRLVNYIVEATCTDDGINAKRCTVCGMMPEEYVEVLPALGHKIAHKTVAATCTVNGREYDYCERCGEIQEETMVSIEATGHVWQSAEEAYVLRAATCNVAGVLRFSCTKCGKTKNEAYAALDPDGSRYTAALSSGTGESASVYGHSLYASETLPATCTRAGDVSRECKYCGTYFVMEVLPPLGHSPSTKKFYTIEEATCTETGLRAPYCANNCGTVMYSETVETTVTVNDVDGLSEITVGETGYPLTNTGKARAKVEATPNLQTFTSENAEETVYNGRTLTPLYAYRYNIAAEGETPSFTYVNDVAGLSEITVEGETYALEEMHTYAYRIDDVDFTIIDAQGKTSLDVEGEAVALTDLGQARATVEEGEDMLYVYRYDLNDAEQFLYSYTDGGETKFFQSNSADETVYDGNALTPLYVYRCADETEVNLPENTVEYEGSPVTPLYAYTYTVADNGEFGSTYVETVPALGHDFKFVETVEPTAESEGYDLWRCSRCGAEEQRNIVPPTVFYEVKTYNIALNGEGETVETELSNESIQSGTQLLKTDLGDAPTLEANETFRYVFKGWSKTKQDLKALQDAAIAADDKMPREIAEGEEVPETDEAQVTLPELVTFPLKVEEDTTLYAVYQPRFVNYVIRLLKEDGTSYFRKIGYLHYGNEITPEAPAKPEDAYGSYVFTGWQLLNPEAGESTTPFETILITRNADYKATYALSGDVKQYVVFWMYGTTKLGEATVHAGENAVYTGATPDAAALGLRPNDDEHYIFTGWSGTTTNVTENLRVYAQFEPEIHQFERQNTEQTCTTGAGYKQECTVCHFVQEFYTNQPLGHKWRPNGDDVLPVVHQDGTYEIGKHPAICERCGITELQDLEPVPMEVTVKDTNGTPLNGAKVTVYRDSTEASKIMSANSGEDGVAHLLVPVAGKYRIVVEYNGKRSETEVTVNESGTVTGGAWPVINAEGVQAGCPKNCTCHKSGLWPTIYRALHTFIYWLTRTRCCPDADYI